jgi:CRISPR-associated protein Cas5a/b/c
MIYSKVFLKLHWGFSVSVPSVSKSRPSVYLPPPTTLIGALSYGKYRGYDTVLVNRRPGSPAYNLLNVKAAASFSKDFRGTYIEDIVRNVILYFQRSGRKTDPKYRYGVIPSGKVYSPNGKLNVVYVTDSIDRSELERLSWSITRIGCKECLVSVEDVEIGEAKKVSGKVRTRYYFPDNVKIIDGKVEYVEFWNEKGFLWGSESDRIRYALPIITYPLMSVEVEVEAKEAYEVGGEYVVFS